MGKCVNTCVYTDEHINIFFSIARYIVLFFRSLFVFEQNSASKFNVLFMGVFVKGLLRFMFHLHIFHVDRSAISLT